MLWRALIGVAAGLALLWLSLLVVLWFNRPSETGTRDLLRLLPDTVRRSRASPGTARCHGPVRARLRLLLAYLVLPIDLGPDSIPVIGYADDAVVGALVLRSAPDLVSGWRSRPLGLEWINRQPSGRQNGVDLLPRGLTRCPVHTDRDRLLAYASATTRPPTNCQWSNHLSCAQQRMCS